MKIHWSFRASLELTEIYEWIAENNSEHAADKYVEELLSKTNELLSNPERHSYCRSEKLQKAKIRCLNFKKKHIVFYKVEKDIKILAIINSKRNPDIFDTVI